MEIDAKLSSSRTMQLDGDDISRVDEGSAPSVSAGDSFGWSGIDWGCCCWCFGGFEIGVPAGTQRNVSITPFPLIGVLPLAIMVPWLLLFSTSGSCTLSDPLPLSSAAARLLIPSKKSCSFPVLQFFSSRLPAIVPLRPLNVGSA